MLYALSAYRGLFGALNLFEYITFRAGGAALTALLISLLAGPALIENLKKHKIGQVQRTDGPSSHAIKQGTPTMGGLLIFISVLASSILWMRLNVRWTWLLIFVSCALSGVGVWDDYLKLRKKSSAGASSRLKFGVQIAVALAVVSYLAVDPPSGQYITKLSVPYGKELFLDIGSAYFFLSIMMIVGSSNAVNLTDGLDGLAAGSAIFCAIAYGVFAYVAGNVKFADYLRIVHVDGAGEISVFLAAIIGSCLGFLWFNAYPAEVFMGDTGSLFLGGVIAVVALCVKQEILLPIVGGVFVLETLSVILQMGSYKLRKGKRVFKMAPLHHHFELLGIAEPKVTVRFWILDIVLMLTALASLKIR
ncbi:MAG: phospho-N-acetylmuramoyl-pentapeptide-transferase [Elusimicrobiota bacterium]